MSLAPSLTELVCALGLQDRLVGRTSACDAPAGIDAIPVVGGFGRPNMEALLPQRPSLVLYTDAEKPGVLKGIETIGARVLRLSCTSWTETEVAARELAAAAGEPARAEAWIAAAASRKSRLADRVRRTAWPGGPPRVFVEVWSDPLTTAGAESHLNELIERAGGVNLGAQIPGAYPHVSAEWVLEQDPAVILIARMIPGGNPAANLRKRPGWKRIAAVRDGRVIADIDPDLLLRPGPRMLDGAEELARRLEAWRPGEQETKASSTGASGESDR